MPFRIQAKNLFLTYPRCLETKSALIDFLKEKLYNRNVLYICVSEELHEDGVPHLHAFVSLDKKLDTQNERYFDAGDYHPNIQKSLHPKENLEYVQKDGDYEEYGECPDWLGPAKRKKKDIFTLAFAAGSYEEAKEIIITEAPDTWATCHNNVTAALKEHFKPPPSAYTSGRTLEDFILPDTFWDWYNGNYVVCLTLYPRTRFLMEFC